MGKMKAEEVEPYWNKQVQALVGKTIAKAEYMTRERADKWDWDSQGLELTFTDGESMILSKDDEGNGPGAAFTSILGIETIPVI